jgi:hypothetical protein
VFLVLKEKKHLKKDTSPVLLHNNDDPMEIVNQLLGRNSIIINEDCY